MKLCHSLDLDWIGFDTFIVLALQATELQQEVYPVLDELTTKISTLNLEHVRRLKSRLVAMTRRVQKVSLNFSCTHLRCNVFCVCNLLCARLLQKTSIQWVNNIPREFESKILCYRWDAWILSALSDNPRE